MYHLTTYWNIFIKLELYHQKVFNYALTMPYVLCLTKLIFLLYNNNDSIL